MVIILGIIVASHGEFAKAAVETLEMIAGKQDNIKSVTLPENMSLEQFESKLLNVYGELAKDYSDIVILCDIYGGTPFNVLNKMKLNGYKFKGFTGFNLPILIDLSFAKDVDIEEIEERIRETHMVSLTEINPILVEEESSLDL